MRKKVCIRKEALPGAILTTLLSGMLLSVVQVVVKPPLLLGERLLPGWGGWFQLTLAALFGGWLYLQMFDRERRGIWRRRIWMLFSIVFFTQLLLGIFADSVFLMSGKLHFPIPGLIPAGVFYRGEMSFMPFLFIVTILLSGGAWCSQLCYFGAWDNLAAGKTGRRERFSPGVRAKLRWTVYAGRADPGDLFCSYSGFRRYNWGCRDLVRVPETSYRRALLLLLPGGDIGDVPEIYFSLAIRDE